MVRMVVMWTKNKMMKKVMELQKVAAEQTYNGQADLGRQLAEAEFRRQVEFEGFIDHK